MFAIFFSLFLFSIISRPSNNIFFYKNYSSCDNDKQQMTRKTKKKCAKFSILDESLKAKKKKSNCCEIAVIVVGVFSLLYLCVSFKCTGFSNASMKLA